MQPIYTTQITKFKGDEQILKDDILVREIKLEIQINDKRFGVMMATPVDQEALAVGYLISENIIASPKDISEVRLEDDGLMVKISAKVNEKSMKRFDEEAIIISGCGRGQTANIDPEAMAARVVKADVKFKKDEILKQMGQFYTQCELYEMTGCVHTAKLYVDENTFFIGEDIAQHNTIDKAVGKACLAGVDLSKTFLMVSGRLSSEMVAKAVMHGLPALVSRTAPTSLGVLIARKFNLTLCGFARGENMNVYSGLERTIG
ncbi:formate dehydrogenase accessory sulfurtransferase FdhD [Campylobacter sp. RM16192]|uniref:formate dehydrogenase accessory sulfurtransferase FdhD n=1 Tax=Campylobacter sp. RM16192 TaxID=1660080 RepID=UPI001451C817|nr:formate dehydrogenase accessory sulfurtransferase FdhD [Campylobacter sp. RM16192]QCD51885.1 formate dehydrogenase accessory protein [Campylobacter sp. RM16192]